MFSVVIPCTAAPDPSVTASLLESDVWERISPLCILYDRIMKFVCFCIADVYEECVLLRVQRVICVMLTHFCYLFGSGYCWLLWHTGPSGQEYDKHTHFLN